MIKYIFSFIIVCLIACGSTTPIIAQKKSIDSQTISEDKILWSPNRNLSWVDFKGIPVENKGIAIAATQCEIKISNVVIINNLPKISLETFFIKSKSWTITNDTLALNHEQLHFDIYELFSRRIRQKFKELNGLKELDIKIYQNYYDKLVDRAIKENKDYDNEVYFNNNKQQEWIDRISKELEELKEYEYIPEE